MVVIVLVYMCIIELKYDSPDWVKELPLPVERFHIFIVLTEHQDSLFVCLFPGFPHGEHN